MGEINGIALVSIAVGGAFVYGGLAGKSPLNLVQSVVQGTAPSTVAQSQGLTAPAATGGAPVALAGVPGPVGEHSGPGGGASVIVAAAQSQIGKPYVWNTPASSDNPDPASFDCSGLTMWCYKKIGVTLVHYTGAQYLQTKHRPMAQAQPGDLVFFGSLANIHHVGIYVGGGKMIDAPDVGIPVGYRNVIESDNLPLVGYV